MHENSLTSALARTGALADNLAVDLDDHEIPLYRFSRGLLAAANRDDRRAVVESGATRAVAGVAGRLVADNRVHVPPAILARALGTAGGAGLVAGKRVATTEALRPTMAAGKAGVTMLPGLRGDLVVAPVAGGSPYWVTEGTAPPASSPTLGGIAVTPRTVATTSAYTRDLLLVTAGSLRADDLLLADQARAVAGAIDGAILAGTGADGQPEGIIYNSDVPVIVGGTNGVLPTWDHLQNMLEAALTAGADPDRVSWIMHPSMAMELARTLVLLSGSEVRLAYDPDLGTLLGRPLYTTASMPVDLVKGGSSDCQAIICGDFSHALLAIWGGLEVIVDPFTLATTGVVRCTTIANVGVAVRQPAAFAIMRDARLS